MKPRRRIIGLCVNDDAMAARQLVSLGLTKPTSPLVPDKAKNAIKELNVNEIKELEQQGYLKVWYPPLKKWYVVKITKYDKHLKFGGGAFLQEIYRLPNGGGVLRKYHLTCNKQQQVFNKQTVKCSACSDRKNSHQKCKRAIDMWMCGEDD